MRSGHTGNAEIRGHEGNEVSIYRMVEIHLRYAVLVSEIPKKSSLCRFTPGSL